MYKKKESSRTDQYNFPYKLQYATLVDAKNSEQNHNCRNMYCITN